MCPRASYSCLCCSGRCWKRPERENTSFELALSLLGRFRGGPAKAAVLGSGLTGMVSGSSIANVVTTGTFTIPLMKRVGYPATKAAAIEVAAGIDGQIMPPVMGAAAFIMAEYLNVPYLTVVKAAVIPAVLSYCGLFYITHVEACKLGMKGMSREELPRFREVWLGGFHYMIPMAILIVELVWFRHSPQMSVLRAIVVLATIIVIQHAAQALRAGKSIWAGLKESGRLLVESLANGGKNMVSVAVATACAGIIVGVVTLGMGGLITEFIDQVSAGQFVRHVVRYCRRMPDHWHGHTHHSHVHRGGVSDRSGNGAHCGQSRICHAADRCALVLLLFRDSC